MVGRGTGFSLKQKKGQINERGCINSYFNCDEIGALGEALHNALEFWSLNGEIENSSNCCILFYPFQCEGYLGRVMQL